MTPAASIPESVADKGGALIIVNMQDTPLDGKATVRVQASVDDVMAAIMRNLGLVVAPWDEGAFWKTHADSTTGLTTEAEAYKASAAARKVAATTGVGVATSKDVTPSAAISRAAAASTKDSVRIARSAASSMHTLVASYAALELNESSMNTLGTGKASSLASALKSSDSGKPQKKYK